MAAAASPGASPAPPALPTTLSLSRAERALATFLRNDVVAAFARAAQDAQREDVYLALNQVLCLDDTLGAVRVLQHFLPPVLREIHADLARPTARDLRLLALRTLSYFLHHGALAAAFPDAQVERFLTAITGLLAATPDERTYKACLWCLTMQDVDLARLDFLPRIVEALVLAIINPFHSRPIAIHAIKGLHRLAAKFASLMIARAATFRIWFRPVVSRLASSDKTTRDQVVLALQQAAAYSRATALPGDVDDAAAAALVEYAVPALHAHVTHERYHEALTVWQIVLIVMRRKLATDVALLNDLLAIAEPLLRHADASVRLQSIDVWRHVVGVFRATSHAWVFEKHVVVLLVRPIVVCLEAETTFNVLHAAISTWRALVGAAVEDFNAFCASQGRSVEAIQQSAKKLKWKKWLDELVRKVVGTAVDQERSQAAGDAGASHAAVHDEIRATVRELLSTATLVVTAADSERTTNSVVPEASAGSSSTTTTASSNPSAPQTRDDLELGVDPSERDEQLLDAELLQHSASASLSIREAAQSVAVACPPLSSSLLGLAIVLPDVLKTVERLGPASDGSAQEQRFQQLGLAIWDGFCARLTRSTPEDATDQGIEKMRLRLVRFCVDFTFGLSHSSGAPSSSLDSQASALVPSLPTDSVMTAADLINGHKQPHAHSVAQVLHWQLRLLHQVVALASSTDELAGLFSHPKSRISQHLLHHVDRIVDGSEVYKEWLAQWDQAAVKGKGKGDGDVVRIDFSAKSATLLCVMVYLLLSLAQVLDADDARSDPTANERLWEVVGIYSDVVDALHKCVDVSSFSSEVVARFCHLVVKSPSAAKAILERDAQNNSSVDAAVGRLLSACTRAASRREDTQDNAAVLLQLRRSPVKVMSPPRSSVVASLPTVSEAVPVPARAEDASSAVSGSDTATSPCMLQVHRNASAAARRSGKTAPSSPPPRPTTAQSTVTNASSTPLPAPQTPVRPKKSSLKPASTPNRSTGSMPARGTTSSAEPPQNDAVFPDLVDCTDPIAQVYGLLPFSFRQIAPFYKIETVGHLAGMIEDQVKKMGIKDGAAGVRKALAEYQARRARSRLPPGINSPFRQRMQSPPAKSPAVLPSPSPKRILKRPTDSPKRLPVTSLPFESPQQRKRARRSLHELSSSDGDASNGADESTNATPSEQRVTFRLEMEGGASRITHPGSDSQDAIAVKEEKETENPHEKLESFYLKMDQHLRRSLYYAQKIAEEEASLHSSTASLGEEASKLSFLTSATERSLGFVAAINAELLCSFERRQNRAEQAPRARPAPDPARPT